MSSTTPTINDVITKAILDSSTTFQPIVVDSSAPPSEGTEGGTDRGTYNYTTATASFYYSATTGAIYNAPEVTDSGYIGWLEIALAVFFIALTMATVVGNMMALTVFTRISVTKTVSVIFFTSMAIADLMNGIFVMPFSVYSLLHQNRALSGLSIIDMATGTSSVHLGNFCTFCGIVMNTSTKAALFTLILICFDRFISVHDALRVHRIMTIKNCGIMVAGSWTLALFLAIFPFLVPDPARGISYNYRYVDKATQCTYRVEETFDMTELLKNFDTVAAKEGDENKFSYPNYITVTYFFINIIPIIVPTYLIIFFCLSVIVILRNIFANTKRVIQQIEPPEVKRTKSFNYRRGSVQLKELRSSFKRKASEKPLTTQITKVDAGYSEKNLGQGTAPDHLEGQTVLRRASRRITQGTKHSPQIARDRWSQISVKSLQKRTKADHQRKAINTVVLMLMFFVFCYLLEWFCIILGLFIYTGVIPNFYYSFSKPMVIYLTTLTTIMKYLNSAGNPFLYYFRMSQFQKEVRGITQSWNGTTNRLQTSNRNRSKGGYVSLNPGSSRTGSTRTKPTVTFAANL